MTRPNSGHPVGKSESASSPVIRELSRQESEQLLARNHVGRIAFTFHDRVDIEPIHYVFDGAWIYGRTSHGTKLEIVAHHRWVAFEVDEVNEVFAWQSVVVKGTFELIEPDTPEHRNQAFARGVDLLRSLVPETLTAEDPTPFRQLMFRIHLDEVTGREASHG